MGKKARARAKRKDRHGQPSHEMSRHEHAGHAADGARESRDPADLAASLFGLSSLLQRQLARADPVDGLTRSRLSALALLVLGGPRTLGRLAADEGVRPPTMTRLVKAMELEGLVVRERHPSDGRSVVIRATPAGEAELDRGRASRLGPLADAIGRLDEAEQEVLEQASHLLGPLLRTSADARGRSDT